GGEGAYTYSLENIPPEQLQIIPASGEIRVTAGFPDPGEITISIAVADGESRTAAAELILTITPAPLAINVSQPGFVPTGLVAEITRATVSGGRPPFTWTLQGNPPAQLAVSGSGRIVAVETAVAFTAIGTHSFSVQVVDADNETASVPLTASVVVAAALNISPASADVTAGITGLTLAQVTLVGNRENYTYVFTFTPVGNAPANLQLAEDANNAGRILLSSAYLRADVGTTHNYRIVADATAAGGTVFTVTLAVGVIDTPAIQLNLSHSSRIFQRGRGPGEITRATASGGLGADVGYIYRFGGTGNLPSGVLEINSANGAIDLLAAATVFADGSGPHENVEIIAESGERRSTITFLYSVWDITVVRATAEVRHQTEIPLGILPDINVINQQGRAYTFGVKNDTGGGSPPVRIATDGRLFAQNLAAVSSSHPLIVDGGRFILDNPRARYTAILRVSATDTNNVGLMATAAIVVRPPPVGLNLEVLTHPAVGEAPGVLLGRLTATGGEGLISDYQFSFVSNALPLTLIHLDNVAEIMLTAAVTTPVSFNPFSFSVAQGGETASSPAIINAGQPIAVSVAPVLLTTNNSGAVATATIINRPGVDPLSLYDFSLHNPANFSGFSNFSINTASGVLQVAAFSAAAAGEIEVRAIYPEARRTLVATVQISVVAPIELNVAPATARTTANVGSGILATATATGGGGNYAYGLVNTPPAQVAINPANGEIRFNAAFPQPTEFTISISVNDGESRIAAAELMLIIAPEELVINVTPGVVTVPTRLTSTIIATAVISGGRMPFITSLQGAPTQVVLNDGGTSIQDSGGTVTVVITAIFTQSAAHIFSVRVQDADGNFRTAAMTVSVVAGPEVGISPSATAPVTAGITGIEIAQAIVTGNRNGLTYTYGITPQAGAPAKLQLATGGGAVRVDSAYLLAEVGNHNYEIIADTAGGESLTSTLTVQVITTPPVILDLSQDSVRLPAASTGEIIGAGAASGGLGSGYVYSLASGPQLAGVFAIDSASGAVNLAAAASVYADGSGPHEDVTVIAQSGEVSATATFLYSIWDVTLNKPSAEVRHQTPPASDLLPSVIIINRQSDAFNNNAIASPGGVGYDNANNRFTAPSGGFVLPNPRLRITLTVSRGIVNTSVPGTIMVTAEIVVRPPPLRIQIDNYADRNRFAARPAI
ncbi:MAG: hypothetical protein HAW59_00010, partial [Betaproteobacteria bacterium]|nr:hypothetical protein [Betaproteobacteria bacterium]